MTEKVYELTTNAKDGYSKWMVRGIKNDAEAKAIAKKGFGKKYYSTLISYYDDYPSQYGNDWSKVPNKTEFIKKAREQYGDK